jgi:hypothetical protein
MWRVEAFEKKKGLKDKGEFASTTVSISGPIAKRPSG